MTHHDGGPPIWWWLWIALIVSILVTHSLLLLRRKWRFPAFAQHLGLSVWPDGSLPKDLSLQAASFHPANKVLNIGVGSMNDVPVITFDVVKRIGRSVSYFTVIGAKSSGFPFGAEAFDPDLTSERLGKWFLMYRPRQVFNLGTRLMPFKQIEAQLRSVRGREKA